jgi:hypothetical protein
MTEHRVVGRAQWQATRQELLPRGSTPGWATCWPELTLSIGLFDRTSQRG